MHLGLVAVPIAAVAAWAAGGAWYSLLSKKWTAALGWSPEQLARLQQQSPLMPMLFSFLAEVVMALVLYVVMLGPVAPPRPVHGAIDGAVLWLGFIATTTGVNYAYQRKSLALLLIDAGHWLIVMLILGGLVGGLK